MLADASQIFFSHLTRNLPFNKWNIPSGKLINSSTIRRPYNPRLAIPFLRTISLFSRSCFFQKILSLCMVDIQERFVIKSRLWFPAYVVQYITDRIVLYFLFILVCLFIRDFKIHSHNHPLIICYDFDLWIWSV